ncbi:MAG: hypothetical protein G5703_11275 [Serratia symbiotica]|nr:hypothetical protein [Serratia symbiotica]
MSVLTAVQQQLAALSEKVTGGEVDGHIQAALSALQTGGKPPANAQDKTGLDADALAVCSLFGHDPKDVATLSQEI